MATGTETAPATGKRHEKLVRAVRAAHPSKTVLKVAAFQKLFHSRRDGRSLKAVALLVALFIDGLKLAGKTVRQLIKGRLFGLARPIKAVGLVLAWHRGNSCGATPMDTSHVKLSLASEGKKVKQV